MQPPFIKFERHSMPGYPEDPIVLTPENKHWDLVIQALNRYGVKMWRRRYNNPDICDGFAWALTVETADLSLRCSGFNDAPDTFDPVADLIETAAVAP
jgi:hypothetical protein